MKSIASLLITFGVFLLCTEPSIAEDVYGCYVLQEMLIKAQGKAAQLFYWFPKCLPGGYYKNVQCNYNGCYCAYIDSGVKIPNTIENVFVDYMREACPWEPKEVPDACAMPPPYYPCRKTSRKYYYNTATDECEENGRSCLGFDTMEDCEKSCVVQKKDRCNFKLEEGYICDERNPAIRYHHDEKKGSCHAFTYNGCGGNSNNYREKWMCLEACAKDKNTELVIKVASAKYIISLPTWIVVERQYNEHTTVSMTVEEFKELEGVMTKISKFPVKETRRTEVEIRKEEKLKEIEKYRPVHAAKNMSRDELCNMEKKPGPCRGFFSRWYFDKKQSKCIKFIYGGCYGNENRHRTATGCAAFCDAEISPTEAERIDDLISSGGTIGGGLLGLTKPPPTAGARSLGISIPNLVSTTTEATTTTTTEATTTKAATVVLLGESDELLYSFER